LAAGLPVVATAIPEAQRLQAVVRTADSNEQFLERIETLLAEGKCGPQLATSRTMDSETWDGKVSEMSHIVERASSARASGKAPMTGFKPRNQELWSG